VRLAHLRNERSLLSCHVGKFRDDGPIAYILREPGKRRFSVNHPPADVQSEAYGRFECGKCPLRIIQYCQRYGTLTQQIRYRRPSMIYVAVDCN
jgi:hypothetical protein